MKQVKKFGLRKSTNGLKEITNFQKKTLNILLKPVVNVL